MAKKITENRMDWVRYVLHLENILSDKNNIYMKHISEYITRKC